MKLHVPAMILVAAPLLPACMVDATDPTLDSDSLIAATHGTEDLFAINLKTGALTSAKIRARFKTKPATLGRFVMGMRTRPCEHAYPEDTCGAWVATAKAVVPLLTDGGLEHDFPTITGPGDLTVGFESSGGQKNAPVVHGSMTFLPTNAGSFFSSGTPIWWYFSEAVGSGGTAFYTQSVGAETNFLGFDMCAMNASRFVSHVAVVATAHDGHGHYEERELLLYARLDAGEKSVLRAEGEHLFVDWCKVDANDACVN